MNMKRRTFVGLVVGVAAATTVGALAAAGPKMPSAGPGGRRKYRPGPREQRGPGDMIMQTEDGRWHSHLMPFAEPFPTRAALLRELGRARAQRLIA